METAGVQGKSPELTDQSLFDGARQVATRLFDAGFQAWFVGGCVRNQLLKIPIKDIDIATDARPGQIEEMFEKSRLVGASFGVAIVYANDIAIEVATFRKDGKYFDHRHPESVEYGTLEEDAARRDFTCNALYQHPFNGDIVDPFGGISDINSRQLRCCGVAETRFNEDALRLLRAVRFSAILGFQIEKVTWDAICTLSPLIQYISPERHREELTKILTCKLPSSGLNLLDQSGLLHWLLPEIEVMKGVEQGREYHPEGDVFVHTLLVMDKLEPKSTINSWAALLHDVGKPATYERNRDTGKISFYQHEHVGASIAEEILKRFRFPNDDIKSICYIVKNHMKFMDTQKMKRSTLRRFISSPTIENELAVHRADSLGSCGYLEYYDFIREKQLMFIAEKTPLLPDPLVTGRDLIDLGLKPGPLFSDILSQIADLQLEDELTNREQAIEWIRTNYISKK